MKMVDLRPHSIQQMDVGRSRNMRVTASGQQPRDIDDVYMNLGRGRVRQRWTEPTPLPPSGLERPAAPPLQPGERDGVLVFSTDKRVPTAMLAEQSEPLRLETLAPEPQFHYVITSQYPRQASNRSELRGMLRAAATERALSQASVGRDKNVMHSLRELVETATIRRETAPLPEGLRQQYIEQYQSPEHAPALVHSHDMTTAQMVEALANKHTLIVTDPYNAPTLAHLPNVVVATRSNLEELGELRDKIATEGHERIIGVGGGIALDMAKAAGIGKELVVIPTILSTNCISTNRSVLGNGLSSFSFTTGSPLMTAVSMKDLLAQPPDSLRRWSQSGFGDLFAEISSAIDIEASKHNLSLDTVSQHDPQIFEALDWVASSFNGYGPATLEKLSTLLHESGIKVLDEATNKHRIGGEHLLYKALMEVNPKLRTQGPTHGQLVAVGALLTAHIFGDKTGDFSLYDKMHHAFSKLGLPITWKALAENGMTREDLLAGLKRIAVPSVKASVLGERMQSGNLGFLDAVLSPPALGKTWRGMQPNAAAAQVDRTSPVVAETGSVWNVEKFKEGRGPAFVGRVADVAPLQKRVAPNVFHLPIKMPGTGYRLPDEVKAFAPIIQQMIDHEHAINPNVGELYALLTIDQGEVVAGGSQRRGGMHVDDFQWGKVFPKQQVDHSYVMTSQWRQVGDEWVCDPTGSTDFFPQPLNLEGLDESKDNIHQAMNAQIDTSRAVKTEPNTIGLMDSYCIHQAPVSEHDGFRTFIRLSFSPRAKQGDESKNLAFD